MHDHSASFYYSFIFIPTLSSLWQEVILGALVAVYAVGRWKVLDLQALRHPRLVSFIGGGLKDSSCESFKSFIVGALGSPLPVHRDSNAELKVAKR